MKILRLFLGFTAYLSLALCAGGQPRSVTSIGKVPVLPSEATATPAVRRVLPFSTDALQPFTVDSDGTWFLAFRLAHPGASAMRVHIQDLNLPEGAQLLVYGLQGGGRTEVAGPYTGSGSVPESSFWTAAVTGSEAVIELQVTGQALPSLPFTITETSSADAADVNATAREPEVSRSMFRGMALTHSVQDGLALFEGDIILGRADELTPASSKENSTNRDSILRTGSQYRWPGGTIPYLIDPSMPNKARLMDAISHWNTVTGGAVRLVPRSSQSNFLYFWRAPWANACFSYVGMIGSMQILQVGDACPTGNVIHEIGHAFGLWHEHSRQDRDSYVKVQWSNIQAGMKSSFDQNTTDGDDYGRYDFGSIMHYPSNAYSANGRPTIETIPAGIPIGQRDGLSTGDIAGIRRLYPSSTTLPPQTDTTAPPPPPPPPPVIQTTTVTVTTNPSGLPVVVDSVQYTSPRTFQWVVGSTHAISAPQPAPSGGTRYSWVRWSDGGDATHSVKVSESDTLYRADYSVAYAVSVSASGGGSVSVNPLSSDGYYSPNVVVTLDANTPPGYIFTGWSGLISGTPERTSLQVNRPYFLSATFQVGSVTLNKAVAIVPGAGGKVAIEVTAPSGARWAASSNIHWAWVSDNGSGMGSDVVSYTVSPNNTETFRFGYVYISGKQVMFIQLP